MPKLELLAEVAVLRDLPQLGVFRGQVGTVVEILSPSAVEIEFSDEDGRTYAQAALSVEELIQLHHQPVMQAA